MARTKTTSPTNTKGACLCDDGTYSKDCCKGETINQGIGQLNGTVESDVISTATTNEKTTVTVDDENHVTTVLNQVDNTVTTSNAH